MKKLEYKSSVSFKRFLDLLVEYIKSNVRLVLIYLTALLLDSFTKMFSVVAIIPLIDFLSNGNAADFQKVTLVFIDVLSTLSMEYTLTTSVLIFILAILLALLAEILFYFIGRKNAYSINYYLISKGMRSFFNRGLKFIKSSSRKDASNVAIEALRNKEPIVFFTVIKNIANNCPYSLFYALWFSLFEVVKIFYEKASNIVGYK